MSSLSWKGKSIGYVLGRAGKRATQLSFGVIQMEGHRKKKKKTYCACDWIYQASSLKQGEYPSHYELQRQLEGWLSDTLNHYSDMHTDRSINPDNENAAICQHLKSKKARNCITRRCS